MLLRVLPDHDSAPETVRARRAARPPGAVRLRAARLALDLSQFRLAVNSGVSLATVSLAERSGLMSRATAERLARALGCTPGDLLPPPLARNPKGTP